MPSISRRAILWAGLLAAGVLLADLLTKALVMSELEEGNALQLPLGAAIAPGRNGGAAFGLLAGAGELVLLLAAAAICALAVLLVTTVRSSRADLLLATALLLGGALANVLDRAGDGAVTDFIDLGAWPTFNFADVAITVAIVRLVWLLARRPATEGGTAR